MTRTAAPSGQRSGRGGARGSALSAALAPGRLGRHALGPARRAATSVWLWPMALMLALGLTGIGGPVMWRDELATWSAASRSLPQLWRMVHHVDAVLGVYYLGMHLWMAVFGDSPAAMRVPSVIAMTGAAGLVALTGRRLGGYPAGLAAGLVFALIPSISRYAQEARPYAFTTLFAALATLLLLRALERPGWPRWLGYGLAVAAAGLANVLALCLIAGHAIGVALACWRAPAAGRTVSRHALAGGFCGSAVAAVIVDSPVILEGHRQAAEQIGSLQPPPFSQLIWLSHPMTLWPELFGSVAVAAVVMVLAVVSLTGPARPLPGDPPVLVTRAFGVVNALIPILLIWAASQGPSSYWLIRYLLFTTPAWALAAGLGITRLGRLAAGPRLRYAAVGAAVLIIGLLGGPAQAAVRQTDAHNWWDYPDGGNVASNYRLAASVIAARQRPGDGIVYQVSDGNHWMVDTGIQYYLRGQRQPADVFLAASPVQAGGLQPVECADPAQCLRGTPRLWVVYINWLVPGHRYRNPYAAIPPGQAAALQAKHYVTAKLYEADGITVALMTAQPG